MNYELKIMFGISDNVKSTQVRPCTRDMFWAAVDAPQTGAICAAIEDALEKARRGEMSRDDFEEYKAQAKRRLPVITPHATFAHGRRRNDEALPSGLSMYDIDHISDPRGYYRSHVAGREAELGVALAHVTPSTEGLRLVFAVPRGMSLGQAQDWMSARLDEAAYDGCVKDMARCSFLVPRQYILYIDEDRLFSPSPTPPPATEPEPPDEPAPQGQATALTITDDKGQEPGYEAKPATAAKGDGQEQAEPCFKGTPYSAIIARWWELAGGEPQKGERNDKLHRLASHLRYITDDREELMLRLMPRYGLGEQEMRRLIHSACSAKRCYLPAMMARAVALAANPACAAPGMQGGTPPEMPRRLPRLVKLLVSRTPEAYRAAVAHAVFPPLAAHLWRTRFRYIDNVEHEATLMNVLMAGTGAGKDCISAPINHIMADIRLRDAENLRRERQWKDEVNSKGANKDKRQRPEGLVIQEIDADMTNPAFVMRTAEADGHFLYTKLNEIDQFDALRGSGRQGQQFQIMCLAFDPGNRYGQTRVGTQSVTEKVTIRFNWNAATTIQKGRRYFARVLTDGPVSRINFCTIPEREIGAPIPVYGSYGDDFDEKLRPYIENLTRAQGLVECPRAERLARRLLEENADTARLTQSRVYENLSFRATVIAWLKACVLYVANGCKWEGAMDEFIRWSLRYDMWCKMAFFGEDMAKAMDDSRQPKPGPRNLLALLPDSFTLADAAYIRTANGHNAEGTRNMLNQWVHRGYIKSTEKGYEKIKSEEWRIKSEE